MAPNARCTDCSLTSCFTIDFLRFAIPTSFIGAILTSTNLRMANLENTDLSSANLAKSNLTFAEFKDVNFTDSDMESITGIDPRKLR
ncbi:MAG TPA: hypothetical protein EYN52_09665 [Alphaproteobacteria bacterium]|nr:hypothetical protein [Alphaproteobacteria bacterium]